MQEYQSPDSRMATIEDSYSSSGTSERHHARANREDLTPSSFFRYRAIKRCCDVLMILLSAPVVVPVLLAVSALVMLSSRGPVFYSHRRIRKDGVFFSMWKFRTMCVNSTEVLEQYLATHPKARKEWNQTHKLRHDPRVTSIGAFLRRYSIDELPQIWNVLTGQMSLVGPRPIVAAEVEKYGEFFSYYCRVKPGLTGLWQVSGRSRLSYDARVAIDRKYVETWSLWKDLVILLKTFQSVVNQDGAF